MNTELYTTYAITDAAELKIIETLWIGDAKAAADKAQTQHPTARVIVVRWNSADNRDTVVYEASQAEPVKTGYTRYTRAGIFSAMAAQRHQASYAGRPAIEGKARAEMLYHAMDAAKQAGRLEAARAYAMLLKPIMHLLPEGN